MKKPLKIAICIIIVGLIILGIFYLIDMNRIKNNKPVLFSNWGNNNYQPIETISKTEMSIVLSLEDEITDNSAWCGTFNLIWNDLKNDLAKQDIVFTPQLKIVENLNKGTFTTSYLSEDSYYKVYGVPSLKLKAEIEKAIKDKFNEKSDILDDFQWEGHTDRDYFLYAMLKKDFKFQTIFTELDNGNFAQYKNVKYFGIDSSTSEDVRNQVSVLYYNSNTDFAIKLTTEGNDEVIISRGNNEKTFGEIYKGIISKQEKYTGNTEFGKNDILKVPNIKFNLKEEFTELENKTFYFADKNDYFIEKAMQTIQFELDKKGGKIKSEAGMMVLKNAVVIEDENREFIVDDKFTIFLKEKNKDLPYFASQISDISQVQSNVEKQNVVPTDKTAQMYITIIEDIMKKDTTLQSNIQFLAIDFTNFRKPITLDLIEEETKQEIIKYLKEIYPDIEIKQNTIEELESQGLAIKGEGIKDGIIIFINKTPELIEEDKATISFMKYRGPLGAYFVDYELKYENNNWKIENTLEAIS